jgi:hypothetical protein
VLGFEIPFFHVPPILEASDGRKISKIRVEEFRKRRN